MNSILPSISSGPKSDEGQRRQALYSEESNFINKKAIDDGAIINTLDRHRLHQKAHFNSRPIWRAKYGMTGTY